MVGSLQYEVDLKEVVMIFVGDYEEALEKLGKEFFIFNIRYERNLAEWAKQNKIGLNEPFQPMKLIAGNKNSLVMVVQSEIKEEVLNSIIAGLSVRWSLMDNAANMAERLDSIKKRLAYCLLKEYARTGAGLAENELQLDEWAIGEMEKLDFFRE